jgi:cytochrome oxidase Cu insertion factor (SCO1/SenC/PrrC family)
VNDSLIRLLRWVGAGLFVVVVAWGGWALIFGNTINQLERKAGFLPPSVVDQAVVGVSLGGPFRLTDAVTGKTVTDRSFPGKWLLLYFGYSFCPDVCPTDLQKIVAALGQMGEVADEVVPILITVDPARDTPEALARYVRLFSPRLIGLTGDQKAIDSASHEFRVFVQKVPGATADAPYSVNHSAFIYLLNPGGQLAGLYPPDASAKTLSQALLKTLGSPGN